jgi:phosphoserine phosphatase RsbU/P
MVNQNQISSSSSPHTMPGTLATLTFVTDRLTLTETLLHRLSAKKWGHRIITPEVFFGLSEMDFPHGAILLDAGDIHMINWKKLEEKIHDLDQCNIPTILLDWPVTLDFLQFRLATKIRSSSIEELWARIETTMNFARVLADNLPVEEQKRQLEEQLKIAGAIQKNFLPQVLPATDKIRFASIYRPAEWVSGDIFDAVRLDEHHIGFYIADAVGHSIPAALLTMFLKHAAVLRRTQGNQYTIFSPRQVVEHLNQKMIEQNLKGCLFATACSCLLDTETQELSFARAGHPYPILLRDGQDPMPLHSRGGLLGVFEEMEFEQVFIQLQKGDKIVIYSDGVEPLIGAVDNSGIFQFTETFMSLCHLPVVSLIDRLEETIAGWQRTSAEVDDVTVLAMEIL